jgi:hypothetical protein
MSKITDVVERDSSYDECIECGACIMKDEVICDRCRHEDYMHCLIEYECEQGSPP